MKKYIPIIFAVVVLALGGGYYFLMDKTPNDDIVTPENQQWAEYKNEEVGFGFQYRTAPDGYVVIDQLAQSPDANPGILAALTLMMEADQEQMVTAGEMPPTLNVAVIDNPNGYTLQQWIETQSGFANLGFLLESAEKVDVDGREGIRFMSDGLYALQNVVVADGNRVYILIGAYIDTESQLYRDFDAMLVQTFKIL